MSVQKRQRATIGQVAKLAGVSITTVSNVINDRTDAMRPATRARVLEAAQTLGYHPSQAARSLAIRQTATIGLVITEIATPLFFGAVSQIERLAREAGHNVLLTHASTTEDEKDSLDLLQEKEVEGVIFLSTSDYRDEDLLDRLSRTIPVVTINRSGTGGPFDRISWDNVLGVASAVRHLADLGHRRIGFLHGPSNRQSTDERFQGYRLGLTESGIRFDEELVGIGDYTGIPTAWMTATERLLNGSSRPSAVIAADDSVAAVVIRTVKRRGLRLPEDVAVVGIDDQPFAELLDPPLTTIRLPIAEAGQMAVQLLLERIGGLGSPSVRHVLPTKLVIRESCGGLPSADLVRPEVD